MDKLIAILKRQEDYARRSLKYVTVDYRMPTVAMLGQNDSEVFLQGDDAQAFVEQVEVMYEQTQTLSKDQCEFIVAYDYLDILY
ncbi:hypothetical protein [Pseudomonas sp. USHLN015]|uniref:hypothetical protein n=1 Tax=Pseudomonas sp. USHLN015 TaxID=3081296 RepID=UPI00301D5355